jgi:hypothetical protein
MIRQSKSLSSCPGLSRTSTLFLAGVQDVDGRDKPGHDKRDVSDTAEEVR